MRPKWGAQYGRKYVDNHAGNIVQMFEDGPRDKALCRGPNRIPECLAQMYTDAHDLPSEPEIRSAISRLMQQKNKGSESSLSCGRSPHSTWPPIIEYLIAKIVNENPHIRPAIALTKLKEHYEEIETQCSVADTPDDARVRQKTCTFKTKY